MAYVTQWKIQKNGLKINGKVKNWKTKLSRNFVGAAGRSGPQCGTDPKHRADKQGGRAADSRHVYDRL